MTPAGRSANRRLHARWAGFDARKKRPVIANVAIARELAGWCWSLAVIPDLPHPTIVQMGNAEGAASVLE